MNTLFITLSLFLRVLQAQPTKNNIEKFVNEKDFEKK
jgi:hypothetical protein